MRELEINVSDTVSCCAVSELYGFPQYTRVLNNSKGKTWGWDNYYDEVPLKGKLTDDEWAFLVWGSCAETSPIVVFYHSSGENKGACTPTNFAKWLRSKGERVTTGQRAKNPSSGNIVTPYLWSPSVKFEKFLENKKKKYNDDQRRDSERGTAAA